ncbi:NAD(P)/FAD-dependent oxidoreductase [Leucobacter sp. GX0328]
MRFGEQLKSDFIIVGGGVHGMAAAYNLALRGAESVLVIEADTVASGASGGFGQRGVRANRRDLRELPLMREANEIWPTLHEELRAPTGYDRTGGAYLIDGPAKNGFKGIHAAETYARVQSALGIATETWTRDKVREIYPGISDDVHGASFVPTDGVASHEATTIAFANAARRLGVQVLEHTRVTSVETGADGGVAAVVTSTEQRIVVGVSVLLANNTGVRDLVLDATGVDLPMWPIYPQGARLSSSTAARIPILTGHETRSLSVKMLGDDIMLTGGWRGKNATVDQANLRDNIAVLQSVFPHLDDLAVISADASRAESASVDQLPIIGRLVPNLYVATGWSGHGWAIAPAVARHLAGALLANSDAAALAAFRPSRFH